MKNSIKSQRNIDPTHDPRWGMLVSRSPEAEGKFYYSVETTGVYCRPTCPARLPLPKHIHFYDTREDAENDGYRPCLRCKPDQPPLADRDAVKVTQACRLIEESEIEPSLGELADSVNLSKFHFQRLFKRITGLSPKEYATAQRENRLRQNLESGTSVTDAIYDAGFGSNSRVYEKARQILGMTPTSYRSGGKNSMIRYAVGACSLGLILVAQSDLGICSIFLGDDAEQLAINLQNRFPHAARISDDAAFEKIVATVIAFVETPKSGLALPLDIRGTIFQQRVWQALREIPPGSTASYADIAARIGAPKSARAVAQACAANPLAVAIPCHRVIRSDGDLAGYRWGVERKRALLKMEDSQSEMDDNHPPKKDR